MIEPGDRGPRAYPRVLVVNGVSIRPAGNSGRTMHNLFRGWPPAGLAQIYTEEDPPDPAVCPNCRQLPLTQIPAERWLRRALALLRRRSRARALGGAPGHTANGSQPSLLDRLLCEVGLAIHAWLDWQTSFPITLALRQWALAFRPDVIYGLSGPLRPMCLQNRLADVLGVPLVPHFMDDWVCHKYRDNWLQNGPRQALAPGVAQHLSRCAFGLVISPAMAVEYARRYGRPFYAIANCIEVPPRVESRAEHTASTHIIAYVGGLHLGRYESLLETSLVLRKLREHNGTSAQLIGYDLRATSRQQAELARQGVRVADLPKGAEALRLLQEASLLLHVEPFDPAGASYLRFSFSTKLPLYLAAGRAILAYGPRLASIEYLEQFKTAAIVTDRDRVALETTLRGLLAHPGLRRDLGLAAWRLACANHDSTGQRERFRSFLAAAAARRLPAVVSPA